MSEPNENAPLYRVVVNHEEQYAIWPLERELPGGWQAEGTSGAKQVCLERIAEVWTDMRPSSLRQAMDLGSSQSQP